MSTSTSDIYFYSDNSNNTLKIIPTNCSLQPITGPIGPTYIVEEPLYDSSGNLIYNNNSNGPGNPYNDYPYNSNSYYKTKYTISGLNDNSSTIKITNTNGFYYIDLNNWIEKPENGSTIVFKYSTNTTLPVINLIETASYDVLNNTNLLIKNGVTETSKFFKGFI